MKKPKLDNELVRIQGMMSLMDELERRIYSLQNFHGERAKKRACRYLLSRYDYMLQWMDEN